MAFLSAYAENNKIPLIVNHTRGVATVLIAGILSRDISKSSSLVVTYRIQRVTQRTIAKLLHYKHCCIK